MDVIEIDAASNNGVDNIRELRESVKYPPAAGRKKVYIIDEVHMLSTGAFNALLKDAGRTAGICCLYFGDNRAAQTSCHDPFKVYAAGF